MCATYHDCPVIEPHGHCSEQACIVPPADDGKACDGCGREMNEWHAEQEQAARDRADYIDYMRRLDGWPEF